MEDAHATILDLDKTDESAEAQCGKGKKGKNSFFAVYDGHGGEHEHVCLPQPDVARLELAFSLPDCICAATSELC